MRVDESHLHCLHLYDPPYAYDDNETLGVYCCHCNLHVTISRHGHRETA